LKSISKNAKAGPKAVDRSMRADPEARFFSCPPYARLTNVADPPASLSLSLSLSLQQFAAANFHTAVASRSSSCPLFNDLAEVQNFHTLFQEQIGLFLSLFNNLLLQTSTLLSRSKSSLSLSLSLSK
jgi:hypothetical protein